MCFIWFYYIAQSPSFAAVDKHFESIYFAIKISGLAVLIFLFFKKNRFLSLIGMLHILISITNGFTCQLIFMLERHQLNSLIWESLVASIGTIAILKIFPLILGRFQRKLQ